MKGTVIFIGIVVLLVLGGVGYSIASSMHVGTAWNCKVIKLENQQIISGSKNRMHTTQRYLIITDKETFISESSLINGKFDNSNIFYHLKEGETYDFKVSGYGKSFITDYRNILQFTQSK